MANVILLWSDSLLRIKWSKVESFLKKLPQRILGDIFMIVIIYFYNNYLNSFLGKQNGPWVQNISVS